MGLPVFRIRSRKFLGLPDLDPLVRNANPDLSLSSSKNSEKTTDFYCFVTFYGFLYWNNDVNVPSKSKNKKNLKKKNCFLSASRRVTDEKSSIRIRQTKIRIRGSGCHGSGTLGLTNSFYVCIYYLQQHRNFPPSF